jgi:glutamate synthase (NADPH) large chain
LRGRENLSKKKRFASVSVLTPNQISMNNGCTAKHGLYSPAHEHDSCGIGFVADVKGRKSHRIIQDATLMLSNMEHRGACGCEENTGDGAGILTSLPCEFFVRIAKGELQVDLPDPGQFAVGLIFLPTIESEREHCRQVLSRIAADQGQHLVAWRKVPVEPDQADIGPTARQAQPEIEQVFIAAADNIDNDEFERQLYIIRKYTSNMLRCDNSLSQRSMFYICSLSSRIIVYKGMLTPYQLIPFYPDLLESDYTAHVAMVHSRFSTNTFPSWDRAQPCRYMSHNGEINTLRGNINWMQARQGMLKSSLFTSEELHKLFPIIEPDCSDSGNFDNLLELLVMAGRSLPEAVMMMIPEAWEHHESMAERKRSFYEYHACLQEPWDGPASISFTDGKCIGAVLDRNGLRPSRYYLTHDDRIIMSSEVGVLPVEPSNVKKKGRLQPGKIFLIDFEQKRLIPDEELKLEIASKRPYGKWLAAERIDLNDLNPSQRAPGLNSETLLSRMQAFGYTIETMKFMLIPLVRQKRDPVGSMGNDSCLACLSDQARLSYDYFRQLFAQVTNPAIDSIREEVIMSLQSFIGPEGSLLESSEHQCQRLFVRNPILRNERLAAIKQLDYRGWKTKTIDITYERPQQNSPNEDEQLEVNGRCLTASLDRICSEAEEAISEGFKVIILSDRSIGPDRIPISSLIACGAVHQFLVRKEKRTQIGIVIETGEAREVHHHCLLLGYGADAINPYLAYEALWQANRDGLLDKEYESEAAVVAAYRKGVVKGILKVMAKMGISTIQSYRGAQVFEALGLRDEVINRCFAGTESRFQGVGFNILATEAHRRHEEGYPSRYTNIKPQLKNPGEFHWRAGGERRLWNPQSVTALQLAARNNDQEQYRRFSRISNEDSRARSTLRGLFKFKINQGQEIPLDEVEPASEIAKRFCTGAMSFGSISPEAHETLALAMNRIGGKSNTGEGGEDSHRFKTLPTGDSKRSAIKQIASGRFGVTPWYLTNADELQIKIAQGAKPGEGGELPGRKVNETIARIRYSTPGVGLISPPPHHDIYSIEDLKQLIHDLKNANPDARISVKLVSEVGVGTIAAGVAKGFADHILISGAGGGTGASPLTSIKHAGLPWEIGLAETHQTLVLNELRGRVVLQTDGGLKTGRDIVIAALLGAEEFGFATAPLITLGCVMMRKCHLNTCPVGVATQDPALRKKFTGRPEYVVNYLYLVAEEARQIMARLGVRKINDLIGRVDLLDIDDAIQHWKADGLDLTPLLTPAIRPKEDTAVRCVIAQNHNLENALDNKLIEQCRTAIDKGESIEIDLPVVNTNRAVGTMLSHHVVKKWGEPGLAEDSIKIKLSGSAGQSLGAFLCGGITLELEGDANDYVGKGLSNGKLIIYPPAQSTFPAEKNIIIGNVALYGATGGQAFIRGQSAERFCVRNSGANAVVEGIGDHGCEYMTGGRAVILGPTGRNFAAGMSGGIAYVWNPEDDFLKKCNLNTVELEALEEDEDIYELFNLIVLHRRYTNSTIAEQILSDWNSHIGGFVKVMPIDYKRVLRERAQFDEEINLRMHGAAADE